MESQEWEKIVSVTEAIKLHNEKLNFDYIILASGTPYDCNISSKADCGLVFNGIIGVIRYVDVEGKRDPAIVPMLEKDGLPLWGHLPVRFEHLIASTSGEEVVFFGKRSYEDFEKTDRKSELVPIGGRCASLISIIHGIVPRYRGAPLFTPTEYIAFDTQRGNDSLIYSACIKARQARFEHGETPQI